MLYRDHLKRILDILLSGGAVLLLSPVLAITALAVRIEDGGPALFRQCRIGRGGRHFQMIKFRSMPVGVGDLPSIQGASLSITRIGRLIRRTNIDELPQLLNILMGDMSIVGPRPALKSQVVLTEMRRVRGVVDCRPGLTGLAQVNSYNGMPEEEKARYDGIYASAIEFSSDLKIILKTFAYLGQRPPTY